MALENAVECGTVRATIHNATVRQASDALQQAGVFLSNVTDLPPSHEGHEWFTSTLHALDHAGRLTEAVDEIAKAKLATDGPEELRAAKLCITSMRRQCSEPLDPRFRSAARLLRALWREDRGLPIGSYVNEDGKRRKLGSRISEAAGRAGRQFPHARDRPYRPARDCLSRDRRNHRRGAARDKPALIHAAHLQFAGALGARTRTRVELSIELLPAFTGAARQLLFEHSPGRGNSNFTGDHGAFDALIRYSAKAATAAGGP